MGQRAIDPLHPSTFPGLSRTLLHPVALLGDPGLDGIYSIIHPVCSGIFRASLPAWTLGGFGAPYGSCFTLHLVMIIWKFIEVVLINSIYKLT